MITVFLEAAVDCRLWFWHVLLGIPVAKNDLTLSVGTTHLLEGAVDHVALLLQSNNMCGFYNLDHDRN